MEPQRGPRMVVYKGREKQLWKVGEFRIFPKKIDSIYEREMIYPIEEVLM